MAEEGFQEAKICFLEREGVLLGLLHSKSHFLLPRARLSLPMLLVDVRDHLLKGRRIELQVVYCGKAAQLHL